MQNSTGKVTLRWDRLEPGSVIRVSTSSGPVHLTVPEGVHPQGTLRTTAGTIRSDLPGVVNEAGDTIELDGDGPVFDIETASGKITLTSSDGWLS
ncbi:MAG: hypothetical protein GY842_18805 [bacterium]|nr:hypothetical protein [bacterium]